MLFYVSDVHDGFQASKSINFQDESILFKDKLKNLSIDLSANTLDICSNTFVECPWFFRCDSNKFEIIKTSKVCDFHIDCEDQSDEKYCSITTHFNCSAEHPVSIDRKKVNDDELDCADLSDECKENSISSAEQMIKNYYLRQYVWITFVFVILSNAFVLKNNFEKLKNVVDKRSTKYYNLLFVLNLSFSDVIFGFVLGAIAITSNKFSGLYCTKDLEWRSSLSCNIIGIITLVSSQASMNILVLLTGFRLYTVYKPFKSLDIKIKKVYFLLLACWIIPLFLSLIPVVFQKEFTQEMVISSNILLSNKNFDRVIKPKDLYKVASNIENVWTQSKHKSIPYSKRIKNVGNYKDWYFNSHSLRDLHPNISIDVKKVFGFYSSSSVCLPDFYSKNHTVSKFTVALMVLNLCLITFIIIGYVLIFKKNNSRKTDKIYKNKSKNENAMLIKVSLIVATDIACWLPIIVFSFVNFYGYQIPDIIHSLTSIVLLPINSLLNPIIYSTLDVILAKKLKKVSTYLKKSNIESLKKSNIKR